MEALLVMIHTSLLLPLFSYLLFFLCSMLIARYHHLHNRIILTAASGQLGSSSRQRLDGSAVQSTDRIVLWSADRADGPYYLDGLAVTIASNYTVTYPEASISHTMDVGMVS